jgi:3'-phosphoadenosine 5'-phosphosulfate (PAPS) 3'-phosphatase
MQHELKIAIDVARRAGELVLKLRADFTKRAKPDGSVVTNADYASAELIRQQLTTNFPGDAVLTEEDDDDLSRVDYSRCWIVDPIDGTSAYVSGSSDFDVYIALVEGERPVVAVAHQPVTGHTVYASRDGGAWIEHSSRSTRLRFENPESAPVIVSRHWLGAPGNSEFVADAARRMGGIARPMNRGISPRTFLTPGVDAIVGASAGDRPISAKEWDVAPLDLIVRAAGGWASDIHGQPLRFNKPQPDFPTGIVLARTQAIGRELIEAIEQLTTK